MADKLDLTDPDATRMFLEHVRGMDEAELRAYLKNRGRDYDQLLADGMKEYDLEIEQNVRGARPDGEK